MAIRRVLIVPVLLAAAAALSGCGGGSATGSGGGGAAEPLPSKILSWVPPQEYTDSSPLNPETELDRFEIFVKEGGSFSEQDSPIAMLSAIDPSTRELAKTFDLANLAPFINKGVGYNVALRAVAKTGMKSDFSTPAIFSF